MHFFFFILSNHKHIYALLLICRQYMSKNGYYLYLTNRKYRSVNNLYMYWTIIFLPCLKVRFINRNVLPCSKFLKRLWKHSLGLGVDGCFKNIGKFVQMCILMQWLICSICDYLSYVIYTFSFQMTFIC